MSDPTPKSIKVLLLEDDPSDAELVQGLLAAAQDPPFAVECAVRLSSALERLARGGIEIVLTDLNVPDSQGLETFRRLHAHVPQVPIVVLTGSYDEEQMALDAIRQGAQDYLVKGQLDGPLIARILRYAIERNQAAQRERDLLALTRRKAAEVEEAYRTLQETQAMLIQAGKLSAIGQLAAGIAHELNQSLAAIRGYAQVLLEELSSDDPHRKDVELIEEQTDRMRQVVDNIRTFARPSKATREPVDLRQPIDDALMLVTAQLTRHHIEVVQDYEEGLPKVLANRNQLQQVCVNLITNARDALDRHGGGKLWVVTRRSEISGQRSDSIVEMVFGNDGPPIPVDIMDRIFDPFFTTKEPGQGTGLGLSISYGIIKDHHGAIAVENKEVGGVEFRITLPVATPVEGNAKGGP